MSFRRPDKNRFAYRLEGLEEQWVEAGSRRFASYTSVPPGDYVFRARAANADGVWNEQGVSVRIKIAPPLWARWWAYLLYAAAALALLGALAAAHRYKVGREREINRHLRRIDQIKDDFLAERDQLIGKLEARNADLARINYTVSHDLKSPVVTIKNYLGLLQRDTTWLLRHIPFRKTELSPDCFLHLLFAPSILIHLPPVPLTALSPHRTCQRAKDH